MAIQKLLVINDVVVSRFASSNCYYNYPNPALERMRGGRRTGEGSCGQSGPDRSIQGSVDEVEKYRSICIKFWPKLAQRVVVGSCGRQNLIFMTCFFLFLMPVRQHSIKVES